MKQFARCTSCNVIFPMKQKQQIAVEGKAVGVCPECYQRLVGSETKECLLEVRPLGVECPA